jgi:hypothetical protein
VVRKKSAVKKEIKVVKEIPKIAETSDVSDLQEYALQAEQVELLKRNNGWLILESDLNHYKREIGEKLPYINPKSQLYEDSRILYIASDKALKMVEDYIENKKRALELLDRLTNPEVIALDVDNR